MNSQTKIRAKNIVKKNTDLFRSEVLNYGQLRHLSGEQVILGI